MVWIHICSIYSTAWKSKYDIKCVTKYMRVCLLQFLSSEVVFFFFTHYVLSCLLTNILCPYLFHGLTQWVIQELFPYFLFA